MNFIHVFGMTSQKRIQKLLTCIEILFCIDYTNLYLLYMRVSISLLHRNVFSTRQYNIFLEFFGDGNEHCSAMCKQHIHKDVDIDCASAQASPY